MMKRWVIVGCRGQLGTALGRQLAGCPEAQLVAAVDLPEVDASDAGAVKGFFEGLGPVEQVWMSHFDSVTSVGPEFEELGHTTSGDGGTAHRFAAIGSDSLRRYGFQYHPEVDGTTHGDVMIRNFKASSTSLVSTFRELYLSEDVSDSRCNIIRNLKIILVKMVNSTNLTHSQISF